MITIMGGLRIRLQMTKLLFLHRDKAWFDAVKRVHAFLDKHIDKVLTDLQAEQASGEKATYINGEERSDLLYTIAPHGPTDREALRSHILNVFFSSNETTSILISNVFYALARHPHVYEKLRKECLSYGDGPLTWDQMRSMTYLRYVLNESECASINTFPPNSPTRIPTPSIFCSQTEKHMHLFPLTLQTNLTPI
jgi:cytochrome P450 monooxygenase